MRMCPHRIGEQVDFATQDDPNTLWPQTTWNAVEGSFPLASNSAHALGSSGGSETHTLTVEEMPSHTHGVKWYQYKRGFGDGIVVGEIRPEGVNTYTTVATGGGSPHSIMPPFVTVNRWKRVA